MPVPSGPATKLARKSSASDRDTRSAHSNPAIPARASTCPVEADDERPLDLERAVRTGVELEVAGLVNRRPGRESGAFPLPAGAVQVAGLLGHTRVVIAPGVEQLEQRRQRDGTSRKVS